MEAKCVLLVVLRTNSYKSLFLLYIAMVLAIISPIITHREIITYCVRTRLSLERPAHYVPNRHIAEIKESYRNVPISS